MRELGLAFIDISNKLINRKKKFKCKKDKEKQLLKRENIEFNLLYDRATKFGLNSGNIDSILMSFSEAKWK